MVKVGKWMQRVKEEKGRMRPGRRVQVGNLSTYIHLWFGRCDGGQRSRLRTRQACADAGVRLRAPNRCYSVQDSDSMDARGGKGLKGGVEREGRASAGERAILEEHKD